MRPSVSVASDYTLNLLSSAKVYGAYGAVVHDGIYSNIHVANSNKVLINDATVLSGEHSPGNPHNTHGIFGAWLYGLGNSKNNEVDINKLILSQDALFPLSIVGSNIHGGGEAENNCVTINNVNIDNIFQNSIAGSVVDVCGNGDGNAFGNVKDSSVTISNTKLGPSSVYGGEIISGLPNVTDYIAESRVDLQNVRLNADKNMVTIKDQSDINGPVKGGYISISPFVDNLSHIEYENDSTAYNISVNNNIVTISDNTYVNGSVIGGQINKYTTVGSANAKATANGNVVTIKNNAKILSKVVGGSVSYFQCDGDASNNIINIYDSYIEGDVIGGEFFAATHNSTANSNNINIYGGHIKGNVIGGDAKSAKDNIVTWKNGVIDGYIVGDYIVVGKGGTDIGENLGWNDASNSTFNFYASAENSNKSLNGLYRFKNYNFYIDNSVVAGSTLITVNNTVDMRQSNIGVAMTSDAALNIGDSIKLLSTQGLKTKENIDNALSGGKFGRAGGENIYDVYDFTITNDGCNLNATVGNRSSNPKSEDVPASRQPEVALIDDKLDIVDTAYQMSIGKSEPVIYYDFNYTDVKKGDLTLRGSDNVIGSALTKGDEEKKNTITQGPFVEYGNGSYGGKNFYSTGGVEGSGSNKKYGVGYLFRQVKFGKHHFDAYVRTGKINNEFRSFMQGVGNVDYDNSDVYYAAHFGYGQYMPIDPHTTMDVYGKYFYKIIPGSSTTTHVNGGTDINTEFDALTSHKFRIGSKITWDYMEEKKKMMFADLALEHELSHTQTSKLGDRVISNSSGADTTAVMEIGYRQVFGPKDAFLFTADLQGYAGTRTGFGGNIGVRFNF